MKLKKIKLIYRIFTGLFVLMMITSSIADLMRIPEAVNIMTHLGFPLYVMPFLGVAKLLGITALIVRGFPKIKEWAYAGFVFNLTGALYVHISVGDSLANISRPFIFLVFLTISYLLYWRKLSTEETKFGLAK